MYKAVWRWFSLGRTRRRTASRLLRKTRNWLRYGQKEVVYPNHFFVQLAVCAVLFLAICGLKSVESEPVQAALADIRQAATTEMDLGESIGKLEFVGNFVPESVMVFWNAGDKTLSAPLAAAQPLLTEDGWTLFEGEGALLAGGEGKVESVTELESGGYCLKIAYDNGLVGIAEPLAGVRVAAGERVHEGQSVAETMAVGQASQVRIQVLDGEEPLSAEEWLQ